jgi:hypothetical protein
MKIASKKLEQKQKVLRNITCTPTILCDLERPDPPEKVTPRSTFQREVNVDP